MQPCWECDAVGEVHHHHPVPRSRGGTRTIPLCIDCHGKAHDSRMARAQLTKDALAAKKARGEMTGMAPLGKRVSEDGVHLVRDETETRMVERARELRAAGVTVRATADTLTQEGYRTRKGGPIQPTTIQRLWRERRRHGSAHVVAFTRYGQALFPF